MMEEKRKGAFYFLQIDGSPEEQERIFQEVKKYANERFPKMIRYVTLDHNMMPASLYLKDRTLSVAEKVLLKAVEVGAPALIEKLFSYVFGSEQEKEI